MKRKINQESFNNTEKLGKQLEDSLKEIKNKLGEAPLGVLERVDTFENERLKIDEIIDFYQKVIEANEIFDRNTKFLESNFLTNKNYSLDFLKEKNFLSSLSLLIEKKREINCYEEINLVKDMLIRIVPVIENHLNILENSFFKIFVEKIPDYDENLKEFSFFLQKNTNKKTFLEKYTNSICNKFRLGNVYRKRSEELDKIAYLDTLFNKITQLNSELLFSEDINPINQTITKLLVADAKSNLSDSLMKVEKRNKPDDIIFLLGLISIFHEKKSYEDFSDIKEECYKMINNVFVGLLGEIGLTTRPNKFCMTESFIKNCKLIVDTFDKNEELSTDIINKVQIIKSKENQELKTELGKKCFTKLINLSDYLEEMNKKIYLINNLIVLKEFLSDFGRNNLNELIKENTEDMKKIWKNELKKREGRNVTDFLDSNLQVLKKYTLPPHIRSEVIGSFKESVFDSIKSSSYRNKIDYLEKELDEAFIGL